MTHNNNYFINLRILVSPVRHMMGQLEKNKQMLFKEQTIENRHFFVKKYGNYLICLMCENK